MNFRLTKPFAHLYAFFGGLALFLVVVEVAPGASGDLDLSFGVQGKVTQGFADQDYARGVAVQADGKMVVAGDRQNSSGNTDFAVARYTTAGALDTTFNSTGKVTTAIGAASSARAVAVQADGKIVVAGYGWNGSNFDLAVARYTTAGALDTSFNSTGTVTTAIGSGDDFGNCVAIQSDGKIVVGGYAMLGGDYDWVVVRYTSGGALDTTFNGTGKQSFVIGTGHDYATGVGIQSDGKIVVAGYAEDPGGAGMALARLTSAGALDSTFATGGRRFLNATTYGAGLKLQGDDKMIVTGYAWNGTDWDLLVRRFNLDGSNDSSFGTNGVVQTDVAGRDDFGRAVTVQGDGKVVVTGQAGVTSGGVLTFDTAAVRYTSSGVLDTTFGGTGKVTTDASGSTAGDTGLAIALQSDGQIVVAGSRYATTSNGNADFSLLRFSTTGGQNLSTGTDFCTTFFNALAAAVQPDGKTIVVGDISTSPSTTYDIAFARYNADGTLDSTFYSGQGWGTLPLAGYDDHARSVVVQNDGKIVIAGDSYNSSAFVGLVDAFRLNADGSWDASFGSSGGYFLNLSSNAQCNAVALQADGKIVLAGYAYTDASSTIDLAVLRLTAAGALDTTFNSTGYVFTDLNGGNSDTAATVAVQADGKIVVAGDSYNSTDGTSFALARYNTNGSLDTSFNGTGKVITPINGGDHIYALAVQANGRIVAAGKVYAGYSGGSFGTSYYDMALARYNSDGSLDTSFNGTGKVVTSVAYAFSGVDVATSLLVRANGKILVGGYTNINGDADFALLRYNANGSLDTSLGGSGIVRIPMGTTGDFCRGLGMYGGEIILAGSAGVGNHSNFALTKVQSGDPGSLDTSFGSDGVSIKPFYSGTTLGDGRATCMVIQPDGKTIAAGWLLFGNKDYVVARYNIDGSLDSGFGTGGVKIIDFAGFGDSAMSVALQSDGRILVGGEAGNAANQDFGLVRLNQDGSLDTHFDSSAALASAGTGSGKVILDWNLGGQKHDRITKVLVQADGKIIAAGYAYNATNAATFAIARYNSNGTLDTSYGTSGKVTTAFGGGDENGFGAALDANGMLVVGGTAKVGGQYDVALARYTTTGALDASFGTSGKLTLAVGGGYDEINTLLIQPDGKIFALGIFTNAGAYDFIGLRFNANGTLDPTFDGDGRKSYQVGAADDFGNSAALQADGRIVLAGYYTNGSGSSDMVMFRINTDGSLDTSFNSTGYLTLSPGPGDDRLYGVAIDAGNNIVAVGQSNDATNHGQFAMVRVLGLPLPAVSLAAISGLAQGSVILNGAVNARGTATTAQFEYGLTTGYGSTAGVTLSPNNGSSAQNVSARLLTLNAGTTYHYRLTATTAYGTSATSDATFTTPLVFAYTSATVVPVTANGYTATGNTASFSLNFAPATGTSLTVVNNTGTGFINGRFSNLAQGQTVTLSFNGALYRFVANYYGGTGNDLVLQWADVRLLGWGSDFSGQLGNNSTANSLVATPAGIGGALAGKTVMTAGAGQAHSVALCWDGTLAAWGYNAAGQLGDNSTTDSLVPVAVNMAGVLAGKTVVSLIAGGWHNLVQCSDGTLAAWGLNTAGQLGNNSTTDSHVPVLVNMAGVLAGKTVISVAAGFDHSLALCSDGTVAAWGDNGQGQLGINSLTSSPVPVAVNTAGVLAGKTVVAVAAGSQHSLALCSDGTLVAWGYNNEGQLGINSTTRSLVPVAVNVSGVLAGKTVASMAAGSFHNLVLCSDGTLAAWGRDAEGQLGNNSTTRSLVPVVVLTTGVLSGKTVTRIKASSNRCLAQCADGTLAAWGANNAGQLGINGTTNSLVPATVSVATLAANEAFIAVHVGSDANHTLALAAAAPNFITLAATAVTSTGAALNGTVNAQGSSTAVSFEYGLTTVYGSTVTATPSPVSGSSPAAVSAAVPGLSPGSIYHFRVSGSSSAGTSTGGDLTFVTPLSSFSATYSAATDVPVTVGAVTATGATANLTLGFAPETGTELMVVKNTGLGFINGAFSNIAQGQTVTLSYNGVNYNFVANYYGGTGNDLVLVWKDRRAFAWGINNRGQLGDNSITQRNQAVPVTATGVLAGKTILSVVAGSTHSLALCSDGTVAAWGYNAYGQLGINSTTDSPVPVAVTMTGVLAGRTVVAVAAGDVFSVALCSDGTVAAWGYGGNGQLGNNSTAQNNVPVAVNSTGLLAGKTVVAIAAGTTHTLALCADGTVAAWGYNGLGQLGNNSTTQSTVPVAVDITGVLSGKTVVAVAAGDVHSVALCSDGTVAAWGYNGSGQLGNNSTAQSTVPVAVDMTGLLSGRTVAAIAAGSSHTLALCSDGTLAAWGFNGNGQLGNNSTAQSTVPVAVSTAGVLSGKTALAIASGNSHTLALCSNGTLASWGYNGSGQLGNNSTTSSTVPVAVSTSPLAAGERFIGAASGSLSSHTLALVATPPTPIVSTLAATALTGTGAVLNGTVNARNNSTAVTFEYGTSTAYGSAVSATPSPVTGSSVTAVGATLGGLSPGTVYHFRVKGASNAGTSTGGDQVFATSLSGLTAVYTAATDVPLTAGAVTANGATANLTLGFAPATGAELMVVKNTGLGFISGAFSNIAQGQAVTLSYNGVNYNFVANYCGGTGNDLVLVWKDSRVFAWGSNTNGQLGDNSITQRNQAVPVTATGVLAGRGVISVAVGGNHSLALCSDGTVAAWGYNGLGQLGNNSTTDSHVPVAVNTAGVLAGKTVVAVAAGFNHSLALCSDGTVAAWGFNGYGRLGNNSTTESHVPVLVDTTTALEGKTVVAVAAGAYHNLALCSDGALAAWGAGVEGELGNNSAAESHVPVLVDTTTALAGKTVVAVAGGGFHSLALCSDGTVAAWGMNSNGQLGDNTLAQRNVPVAVNTAGVLAGKTVTTVVAGYAHSAALCADGTVAAWGSNSNGQLGNNSTVQSALPVAASTAGVLAGKTLVSLSAGQFHTLAQCSDGTLATWGMNTNGQLGNNSTTQSTVPVAVSSTLLAAGEAFTRSVSGQNALHSLVLVAAPPAPIPVATTLAATSITTTGAILNGTVNASASSTAVSFDYGLGAAYGSNVAATPTPVTGSSATAVAATLTGLSPGTTYHFRVNGVSSAGYASGTDFTFTTTPTVQQSWRQTWFGTTSNTGSAADDADPDHDGIPNLIEWGCHLNPLAGNSLNTPGARNGPTFEFVYTRSVAARSAGALFVVEWSDALAPNGWSVGGVTEQVLSDDGVEQRVKALIPVGLADRRFVHLKVAPPP